jgi:hypothetical protein
MGVMASVATAQLIARNVQIKKPSMEIKAPKRKPHNVTFLDIQRVFRNIDRELDMTRLVKPRRSDIAFHIFLFLAFDFGVVIGFILGKIL